jgi:hypothetical protein
MVGHGGRKAIQHVTAPSMVRFLDHLEFEAMEAATAPAASDAGGIINWPPEPHYISESERWAKFQAGVNEPMGEDQ